MIFTKVAEAYSQDIQGLITHWCDQMEWQEMLPPPGLSVGMMPGLGIKAAIQQLRLPKVSHVAISNAMAPYGLCGIRCRYKDGPAEIFLLDIGTEVKVLCHRLLVKPTATPSASPA